MKYNYFINLFLLKKKSRLTNSTIESFLLCLLRSERHSILRSRSVELHKRSLWSVELDTKSLWSVELDTWYGATVAIYIFPEVVIKVMNISLFLVLLFYINHILSEISRKKFVYVGVEAIDPKFRKIFSLNFLFNFFIF